MIFFVAPPFLDQPRFCGHTMAARRQLCSNLHPVLYLEPLARERMAWHAEKARHLDDVQPGASLDFVEHAVCSELGVVRQCCIDALLRDVAPDEQQIAYQYNIYCKTMDSLIPNTSRLQPQGAHMSPVGRARRCLAVAPQCDAPQDPASFLTQVLEDEVLFLQQAHVPVNQRQREQSRSMLTVLVKED